MKWAALVFFWATVGLAGEEVFRKNADGTYSVWCEKEIYLTRATLSEAMKLCADPVWFPDQLDQNWGDKGRFAVNRDGDKDYYSGSAGQAVRFSDGSTVLPVVYPPRVAGKKGRSVLTKLLPDGSPDP